MVRRSETPTPTRVGVAAGLYSGTGLFPRLEQLSGFGRDVIDRNRMGMVNDHHGIDSGQRIDLRRQGTFFAGSRALRAPVIDRVFQVRQGNMGFTHGLIVRARSKSQAHDDTVGQIQHEIGTQISSKRQSQHYRHQQCQAQLLVSAA